VSHEPAELLHSPPFSHGGPGGHIGAGEHEPPPEQLVSHAHDCEQSIPPLQLDESQRTSQRAAPHVMAPAHALLPVHSMSQLAAPAQLTPPAHASSPVHSIEQVAPAGHWTWVGQLPF
jgi:hypothetical protein